ncbi:unnamed protein product [Xylocopa violacea]|uniref:Mitochondrial import inner membrane translocase subunit n=1 Tax=Xylocopa violacea TaxID=135666 RepID=A0ABP1P517_XYLVO
MRFMEEQRSNNAIDVQFQAFLERENTNQQFQRLASNLTDICWQVCIEAPGRSLDLYNQNCLVNCVERFIDTNNFITYRLGNIILTDREKEQ